MTKQDVIKWYNTSILPSDGTEELNKFMLDVAIHLKNGFVELKYPTRAEKAFKKYGFNEADIKKMYPSLSSRFVSQGFNGVTLVEGPGPREPLLKNRLDN